MTLMFQRLARNFVKDGYFPTDADTTGRILSMLEPSTRGTMRLIDPCAGEGIALAESKAHLGRERSEAYGVEYNRERAWHAKELLDRVIHGDYQDTIISPKSFGLLWLNPPYGDLVSDKGQTGDSDSKGRKRLEKLFYQRSVRLLQPGGVLVLIVPTYTLDRELIGWIAGQFHSVVAYRAAVDTYQQAVVVGVRSTTSLAASATAETRAWLEAVARGDNTDVLPEFWPGEPYSIPPAPPGAIGFRQVSIDPAQLLDEMRRFPCLWPQLTLHLGRSAQTQRRPLRALSRWHLALALAAGQVAGVVRSNDGSRTYVIKGDTHKDKVMSVTTEEHGDRITEVRTATDVFVAVIRALDFTEGSPTFGQVVTIR